MTATDALSIIHAGGRCPTAPAGWPAALHSAVDIIRAAPLAMLVAAGEDVACVCNPACAQLLGDTDTQAAMQAGAPLVQLWPHAQAVACAAAKVLASGTALSVADVELIAALDGVARRRQVTLACSPLAPGGDGAAGAAGVIVVLIEQGSGHHDAGLLDRRLLQVRSAERHALAREVHDQLGQTLSRAKIDVTLLQQDVQAAQADGVALPARRIASELRVVGDTLDRAVQQIRDIAFALRAPATATPTATDTSGVYAAMEAHAHDFARASRIGIEVRVAASLAPPPRQSAEALLPILQEALTNVLRHARAQQVWISIDARGAALLLRVRDDGAGIVDARLRRGRSLGLTGMRERAELAGGRLGVRALGTGGTLVSALLPLVRLQSTVAA